MSVLGSMLFALAFGLSLFVLYRALTSLRRHFDRLADELLPRNQRMSTGQVVPISPKSHRSQAEWRKAA